MTRLAGIQKRRAKFPVRNQLRGSFAYMRHDAASWINRDQAVRHDRPGERTSNGQG